MAYSNINKPNEYFNTVPYTGNGSTNHAITGVGFQPDLVWLKSRSNVNDHKIFDVVRGVPEFLSSNLTNAETTTTNFSSIDSDGFTVTTNSTPYNASGQTYASWNWLAGGTGVSNTDGSIASTVSANTTSGFSIVSYTGTSGTSETVGHGLGSAPKMVIVKNRSIVSSWICWNQNVNDANQFLYLNATDAVSTISGYWSGLPTSTTFSVNGSWSSINSSGNNFIAYCFAEKKGFSKFGSYTGNGSTDGTFVYTGFKPAFVMIKQSSGSGTSWNMWDNKRLGYNIKNYQLEANTNVVENTSLERLLITSNGFKCLTDNAQINGSGNTYIYMAFAENPLVAGNYVPTTAR